MNEKATILLVDDEERILRSLQMLFKTRYRVLATTDAREALDIIRRHRVHVIISDQRMPIMRGCDLLREVKEISPQTMRLLLTGYAEMDSIISSVNDGEIFRYIAKPWSIDDIQETVAKAAGIAQSLQRIEAELSQPATTGLVKSDACLGVLVIDQDEQTYHAVREAMGEGCEVRWGATLDQALGLMSEHETAIVVSEVCLGKEDLTDVIKLLKQRHPDVITLVLTSFKDTSTMIGLINQGQVYRFLPKPVRKGLLSMSLKSAIKHYEVLKAQPVLLQRHVVEPAKSELSESSGRVLSYLARMRARSAAVEAVLGD